MENFSTSLVSPGAYYREAIIDQEQINFNERSVNWVDFHTFWETW